MTETTKITVEANIDAPIDVVWACWTTPDDIMNWNAASDDWHTTAATNDLRPGGAFSYRMEARDGSAGFDFAGQYEAVEKPKLIAASLEGRKLTVEFIETPGGTRVRETFDPAAEVPADMQRAGWQAILDNFKRYVESKS